jgi:hypothetical protein
MPATTKLVKVTWLTQRKTMQPKPVSLTATDKKAPTFLDYLRIALSGGAA